MAQSRVGFNATPHRRNERYNIKMPLADKKIELTIRNDTISSILT